MGEKSIKKKRKKILFLSHAQSALDKNLITEELLNERLRYQFRLKMRLGHFDPDGPLQKIPPSAVCTDDALALSRDGNFLFFWRAKTHPRHILGKPS